MINIMGDVKFYIIKGWRIVSHSHTEEYLKTIYTVDTLDEVMKALQRVDSWQYFKVESVEPVYFWD